jgi:hypothetical protein
LYVCMYACICVSVEFMEAAKESLANLDKRVTVGQLRAYHCGSKCKQILQYHNIHITASTSDHIRTFYDARRLIKSVNVEVDLILPEDFTVAEVFAVMSETTKQLEDLADVERAFIHVSSSSAYYSTYQVYDNVYGYVQSVSISMRAKSCLTLTARSTAINIFFIQIDHIHEREEPIHKLDREYKSFKKPKVAPGIDGDGKEEKMALVPVAAKND